MALEEMNNRFPVEMEEKVITKFNIVAFQSLG
jgi:hypothetical protein